MHRLSVSQPLVVLIHLGRFSEKVIQHIHVQLKHFVNVVPIVHNLIIISAQAHHYPYRKVLQWPQRFSNVTVRGFAVRSNYLGIGEGYFMSLRTTIPRNACTLTYLTTHARCWFARRIGATMRIFSTTSLIWRQSGVPPLGEPSNRLRNCVTALSSLLAPSKPTMIGAEPFNKRNSEVARAAWEIPAWK
jgi:hypothetical protein